MQYIKSESNIRPAEVEAISGNRFMIRRDIEEKTKTNQDGEEYVYFTYEEAIASEAEYTAYATARYVESKRENAIIDEYTLQLINEGAL